MTCTDEQTLAMLVARELPEAERRRVEAHVAGCATCEETLRVLVELYVADDPTAADTIATARARRGSIAVERGASLGRFLVIEELGRGGMGVVYAAYDPELDRKVAIKVLRPGGLDAPGELSSRLRREAQAMARLVHPNVVTVLDVGLDARGDEPPRLFVAMEYVEGTTLRGWLEERPRSTAEILRVFAEAGRGLAAAHAAGIVHRDFKPDNVLVDREGHPRVTDFGLARAFDDVSTFAASTPSPSGPRLLSTDLTEADTIVGTPPYMAPEQIEDRAVGPSADQFAWFVALHEALYGVRPFPDSTLQARCAAIRQGAFAAVSTQRAVPSRLRNAVRRGLAFEPTARFQDMHAAVRAIEHARRSRVAGVVLAALPLVGAAVLLALPPAEAEIAAVACPDVEAELRGAWDSELEGRLKDRFAEVVPEAVSISSSVVETLDERAEAWRAAMDEVCAARRTGLPIAPEVAVRADCLRRRKVELAGFVEGLLASDAASLRGAYGALRELPGIDTCSEPSRYLTEEHVLVDPRMRPEIDAVRDELVRARALGVAGRPIEERDAILHAVQRARGVGHPPVLAEALVALGNAQAHLSETESAVAALREAVRIGVSHRHHDVAARALLASMRLRRRAGDHDEVRRLADIALGHVEALGGDDELRRDVLLEAGYGERLAGDLNAARALWDEAAALSSEPLDRFIDTINLAALAADLGHWGAAEDALRLGVEIAAEIYDPIHPATATMHFNYAVALCGQGRPDDALTEYRRASQVYLALYGDAHPKVAEVDMAASSCLRTAGRIDDAARRLREARRVLAGEATVPQSDALRADALVLEAHGEAVDEVLASLDTLAARLIDHDGPDSVTLAELRHGVGAALAGRGEAKVGAALLLDALRAYERRFGARAPVTAVVRADLGLALAPSDPGEATTLLDRALGDLRPEHGHPRARFEALLGRARLREASDPEAARRDREAANAIVEMHPQLRLGDRGASPHDTASRSAAG